LKDTKKKSKMQANKLNLNDPDEESA
jgi:hypothetical protein